MSRYWLVFLNWTRTSFAPTLFYSIYAAEIAFTIFALLLTPLTLVAFYRPGVIHRNFRIQVCTIAAMLGNALITRVILLYYQIFDLPVRDDDTLLIIANILRNSTYGYLGGIMSSFGLERTVATVFWKWYEKSSCSTVIVVIVLELSNIVPSLYVSTEWLSGHPPQTERIPGEVEYSVNFAHQVIVMTIGCIIYGSVYLYNSTSLRQMNGRRSSTIGYSVARSFQIRENIRILKMMLSVLSKSSIASTIGFAMFGFNHYAPREWEMSRAIAAALFDLFIVIFFILILYFAITLDAIFLREFNRIAIVSTLRRLFRMKEPAYHQTVLSRYADHACSADTLTYYKLGFRFKL